MVDKKTRRRFLKSVGAGAVAGLAGCASEGGKEARLSAQRFYGSIEIMNGYLRVETTTDQDEFGGVFEECTLFNSDGERVDRVELTATQRVYQLDFGGDNGIYRVVAYAESSEGEFGERGVAMVATIEIRDDGVEVQDYKRRDYRT